MIAKISISLPEETLSVADDERRATGETRSELFRRALETLLKQRREREAAERYVAGYLADPEEEPDVEDVDALGSEVLERERWD